MNKARKKGEREKSKPTAIYTLKGAAKIRVNLGLTKAKIARLSGISIDTLSKIELGEGVRIENVRRLFNKLNLELVKNGSANLADATIVKVK